MQEFKASQIRNIILLSHSQAGKTSLAEALLVSGGALKKAGSVDEGTTVSDYNDDEKERKSSINSSLMHLASDNVKVNIIDTPGYSDFIGDVIGGLGAADAAVLVIDALRGIEIGTEAAWKLLSARNMPVAIFINKMDKEHANFSKCMESVEKRIGKGAVVCTYPVGKEASFSGIANLFTKEGLDKLGGDDAQKAARSSEALVEGIAESDDALLEKFLDKGELSADEMKNAFKKGIANRLVIPVLSGSVLKDIGVRELLDIIVKYMPSPAERPPKEAVNLSSDEQVKVEPKESAPFSAQVFKTISDPYVGQITCLRIFSGSIETNGNFYNVTQGAREKAGQLFMLQGKEQVNVERAWAGDIICVAKLRSTGTGDSLCDEKNQVKFSDINFPEPALSYSIKPKSRSDEDKISGALHKLVAEDATFKIDRDAQTKEMIASGMGDLHLNMMINRMKKRFGVDVDIGTPKIAYKETITSKGGSQYRHKKQSGGAGQFAEVWMRVEPLPRGTGFEFVDEVVGGAIPASFIVSCEKGIKTAMQEGALAGYPMVDVRAIVYDGKTHPVDSKDIAFQIAARQGFKESVLQAKPVLLEPIMDVDVNVPDEFMGDITGSLNSRRGRIIGMEPGEGAQTVKAQVPLEEMYKWVNELKSITGGRGTYTMRFSHYEVVPSNIAQAIISKAKQAKEEAKA